MRKFLCAASVALAGCAPQIPDSSPPLDARPVNIGQGVGFGGYGSYEEARIARERELRGGAGAPVAAAPATPGRVISSDELSAAGLPSGGDPVAGPPPTPLETAPTPQRAAPAGPVSVNNPGISDEQDFSAVSARESIESDAERLARQRAAYRVIQPTDLPTRSDEAGPNIVEYALSTTNRVGERLYSRSGLNAQGRFQRNCAKYASSDQAQQDFLARGGPQRDRRGLDPDGDGFACYWDPAPFRAARG